MADVFTPILTFGAWVYGLMTPTAPGTPYRTIQSGSAVPAQGITYGRTPGYDAGTTADWFFATTGNDSTGDGSFGNPYATPQKCHDMATAGQTIAGRAGTYYSTLSMTKRLRVQGYGTEVPKISGGLIVTGWTACSVGDLGVVGANWANMYKVTINKSALDATNFDFYNILYMREAGTALDLAQSRKITTNLWEQGDYHTMWSSTTGDGTTMAVNGSGYITTVTIGVAGLQGMTDAQLARCYVMAQVDPNVPECMKITSALAGVATVSNPGNKKPQHFATTPEYTAALLNALPLMTVGQWGFVDGGGATLDLYIWPNNAANLTSGIEIISKTTALSIGSGAADSVFRNIEYTMCADSADSGIAMIMADGFSGLDMQQCIVSYVSHKNRGYGCAYFNNITNLVLKNNDWLNFQNNFGPFLNDALGAGGANTARVAYNYFYHIAQSPIRCYGQRSIAVYFNKMDTCGLASHANKINFYLGCDIILLHGNLWVNCGGYATNQQSSRLLLLNNFFPTNDTGRGYDDQTNAVAPPVDPSDNYAIGNASPLAVGSSVSTAISLSNGSAFDVNWACWNSVGNGIVIGATQVIDQDYNIDTLNAPVGPHDQQITDLSLLYYAPASSDWTTFPGSVLRTKTGKDVTATIVLYEAFFPDLNLRLALDGQPWNPADPGVGPWGKNWPLATDVTAPTLSNFTAAAPNSTVAIGVDTTEISTIYWVRLANGATTPSAAQIIAGQDAFGAAAGQAGNYYANSSGTKAIGTLAGASATYKVCVVAVDRFSNISNIITGSAVISSFAATWVSFNGTLALKRTTALTGAQATTQSLLFAWTFKYNASQNTSITGGMLQTSPLNRQFVIDRSSNYRTRPKLYTAAGTSSLSIDHLSGAATVDTEYLALMNVYVDGATLRSKLRVIKISDGTFTTSPGDDTPPLTDFFTVASTTAFTIFQAAGDYERFMLWDNASADVSNSAVQDLFYNATTHALVDPATAIASVGTPLISIQGSALSVGTNSGSGGDFTLS